MHNKVQAILGAIRLNCFRVMLQLRTALDGTAVGSRRKFADRAIAVVSDVIINIFHFRIEFV